MNREKDRSTTLRFAQVACQIIHADESIQVDREAAISWRSVSGGCINNVYRLKIGTNPFLIKHQSGPSAGEMFRAEAEGLAALAASGIAVPKVIGTRDWSDPKPEAVLVLEWIESANRSNDFSQQLGLDLAGLHQFDISSISYPKNVLPKNAFGLERDNFIGRTLQPNRPSNDWVEFFRLNRIAFQLKLAFEKGLLDSAAIRQGESICNRLSQWISNPDKPSLLHGDLWNGNYMVGRNGHPVLIDPAVYVGHAEAEFGIITLFGGFDQRFFDAYHSLIPKADGFEERVEIYKLYHLLNHVNLFGGSYLSDCLRILKRFA